MGDLSSDTSSDEVSGEGQGLFLNGYAYHKHTENKKTGTMQVDSIEIETKNS